MEQSSKDRESIKDKAHTFDLPERRLGCSHGIFVAKKTAADDSEPTEILEHPGWLYRPWTPPTPSTQQRPGIWSTLITLIFHQ